MQSRCKVMKMQVTVRLERVGVYSVSPCGVQALHPCTSGRHLPCFHYPLWKGCHSLPATWVTLNSCQVVIGNSFIFEGWRASEQKGPSAISKAGSKPQSWDIQTLSLGAASRQTVFESLQQRSLPHLKSVRILFLCCPCSAWLCMGWMTEEYHGRDWFPSGYLCILHLLHMHDPLNSPRACSSNTQASLLHLHSLCCWATALSGV